MFLLSLANQNQRAGQGQRLTVYNKMPDHNHTPKSCRPWVDGCGWPTGPFGATTAPGPALESTCVFVGGRERERRVLGIEWRSSVGTCIWRYKARLVAKGYSQMYKVDYYETFAPVVRFSIYSRIVSICCAE